MKVIFITKHDMGSKVLKGGEKVSKSYYDSLCDICGKENIEILKINERKSLTGKYKNYLFLRDGYDRDEESRLCEYINERGSDIVFFDGSWFGSLINKIKDKRKVIVFLHNVEKQYSYDRMKKNILTALKYISVVHNEKQIIKMADFIITLNKRDCELLGKFYHRKCDLTLPISFKDTYVPQIVDYEPNHKKILLFVGSYFHPNVEGILWFIKKVMTKVECKLLIVGKDMEKLKYVESEKIKVIGTVEDTEDYYIQADAVVMPIFSGGGMKVKTAEAMMYGKKILGTQEALTGYDQEAVEGILKCNCAEDFISAIKNMDDQKYKSTIRDYFLRNYTYESQKKQLEKLINNFEE